MPTPKVEVKQRAGPGGMMLDYVDARYHYDRLDACVEPQNWQSKFERDPKGALRAGIGILTEDGWVWKWDTGTESTMEPQKGEHSDALKRAGVQWGISRDLYDSKAEASGSRPTTRPRATTSPVVGSGGAPIGHTSGGWVCPDHGSFKVIPAGVSKRTGKAYNAFTVCDETGCNKKPPRGSKKPAPVYVAPQPDEFIGMTPEDEEDGTPFEAGVEFDSIEQ
jgi:hypothetical protein